MGMVIKTDLLNGASGNDTQDLTTVTYSCMVEASSIADALSSTPAKGSYDPTGTGLVLIQKQASAVWPDNTVVNVLLTYAWNYGKLTTSGGIKSQNYSYDRMGNAVVVNYTDGGKFDSYTSFFNKRTPTGMAIAGRYETSIATALHGQSLGKKNSATFLGIDAGLIMLVSMDGDQVAPGVYNNRYVFEWDPDGFNPLVAYFSRWGRIPHNITFPGPPPFIPGNGNGWVVPDAYNDEDFSSTFDWVETLSEDAGG